MCLCMCVCVCVSSKLMAFVLCFQSMELRYWEETGGYTYIFLGKMLQKKVLGANWGQIV